MTTYTFSNGVTIINVTPHPLTFEDNGKLVSVDVSGTVINAKPTTVVVSLGLPEIVKTTFVALEEDLAKIASLKKAFPKAILVGSALASQAYPNMIFGLVPVKGFERVPPAEKRMRTDCFTTF